MSRMTALLKKPVVAALLAGGLVVLIEHFLKPAQQGSLLMTVVFWTGLAQGAIAVVCAARLSNAQWILPIKKDLLSVSPVLLFLSLLFLFIAPQMHVYPWMEKQNLWLNKGFFISRNFILLFLTYVAARKFAHESARDGEKQNFYAVVYLLIFVASESLLAFDLVMSLEYPWVSSLFGGYFFVESFYAGLALAGILCFFKTRKAALSPSASEQNVSKTQYDVATLTFGFSLLWAGLFFAQFLVIWYGNIPEETEFITRRLADPLTRSLSLLVLPTFFVLPFFVLLFKRAKETPAVVLGVSILILAGIFVERLVFILPVVPLNLSVLAMETAAIVVVFVAVTGAGVDG